MFVEYILMTHGIGGGNGKQMKLPEVDNFIAKSNPDGLSISLSWTNPKIIELNKTQIFMSTENIINANYEHCKNNGTKIVDKKVESFIVKNLNKDTTYYFKAFNIFTLLGEEDINKGIGASAITKDTIPPGVITNMGIVPDDKKLSLTWENPTDNDFSKVKILLKLGSYPENTNDGLLGYEGSGISKTITGLQNEKEYFIRAFTFDNSGNINNSTSMQWKTLVSGLDDKTGSPGPKKLIAGTMEEGYFGTVPASELFTGSELALEVGITQGTVQFNDIQWLKFAYEGKILFRPQKAFRHSISWDAINKEGCAFGQKIVSRNGVDFKVRLMHGSLTDPSKNQDSDRGAKHSEWNRLILQIHQQAKYKDWDYPAYVEDDILDWGIGFNNEDLHLHDSHGNGTYVWCQDTAGSDSSDRVYRGNNGASYSIWGSSSSAFSSRGWAPVLEVVF